MFGAKVTRQVRVWFTDEQFSDFQSVVESEGKDQSELIRDAVNEYVSDYRERKMFFLQRKVYRPE